MHVKVLTASLTFLEGIPQGAFFGSHSVSIERAIKDPCKEFLLMESAAVTAGGEGSHLGLAGSGQHPVISRVGQR